MPPAARVNDLTAHGQPLSPGPGSPNAIIGDMPAWRTVIDQHACPIASPVGPDGVGSVLQGSPSVIINGQMAVRMGDVVIEKPGLAMGPMNTIVTGCPTVLIGNIGMGGVATPFGLALGKAKREGAGYSLLEQPQVLLTSVIKKPEEASPEKREWIGIKLVNEKGEEYVGEELHGEITDGGHPTMPVGFGRYFAAIPGGSCKFSFPKFYDDLRNWTPPSDGNGA